MHRHRVVVLGGYGVFGRLIASSLAQHPEIEVGIAGRDADRAAAFAASLTPRPGTPIALDISDTGGLQTVLERRPGVVIDAVGPFQARDLSVARLCIDAGVHCIDIADGRERVAGVAALENSARAANVLVVSGASTVPAVSTAIVTELARPGAELLEIDVGISPGHSAPRGLATVRGILGYCGCRIPPLAGGRVEYGWGNLGSHRYPTPVGLRWLSNVDTPERVLWRTRYPQLRRGTVRAGLEVDVLHLGLSMLSRLVRAGLVGSLVPQAARFIRIADAVDALGSDVGAMHVRAVLRGPDGRAALRQGTLIAEHGDGPRIPATPAVLLAKKLLALPGYAPLATRGAVPCMDLFTMTELMAELGRYSIRFVVDG